jgi:trans-aconitate methyltransferase
MWSRKRYWEKYRERYREKYPDRANSKLFYNNNDIFLNEKREKE